MEIQTLYQEAILFAAGKHGEKQQLIPGTNLPYVVHLSNVAMEILLASAHTAQFNLALAIQAALLHDVLEDTATAWEEVEGTFGLEVAHAVLALTKNESLSKEQRMSDSLVRIKQQSPEVWAVKLADRITNLQPPPAYWDKAKRLQYQAEARLIWNELKEGNDFLANRLLAKIEEYTNYIS